MTGNQRGIGCSPCLTELQLTLAVQGKKISKQTGIIQSSACLFLAIIPEWSPNPIWGKLGEASLKNMHKKILKDKEEFSMWGHGRKRAMAETIMELKAVWQSWNEVSVPCGWQGRRVGKIKLESRWRWRHWKFWSDRQGGNITCIAQVNPVYTCNLKTIIKSAPSHAEKCSKLIEFCGLPCDWP